MSPKEQYWTEETQGKTMKIHEEIYDGHLIRANEKAAMVFLDGSKTLETKFTAMSLEDALTKSNGNSLRLNLPMQQDGKRRILPHRITANSGRTSQSG